MNVIEKLRVMLPHWIEHNHSHAEEFSQWAAQLADTDAGLAGQLQRAVVSLQEAQQALENALSMTGGALSVEHGHGHDHHH